jgi:hypothetical protein
MCQKKPMKKTLVVALMSLAVTAYGQGTVVLKNYFGHPNTDPAVFFYGGVSKVTGTQYIAGLEAGPAPGSEVTVPGAGATAAFFTQAAGAGFFQVPSGAVASIPNVAGGAVAYVRVQVWDSTLNGTTTGATYAQAVAYSLANNLPNVAGLSREFSVLTGDPSGIPPGLPTLFNTGISPQQRIEMGIPDPSMMGVPEPSIFGFAGLGIAALMAFRLRR